MSSKKFPDGSDANFRRAMSSSMSSSSEFAAIEFFSGIGGMAYAMRLATADHRVGHSVRAAFDLNSLASETYRLNFPHTRCTTRSITALSAAEVDALGATAWTMSPPCQPFTQGGKRLDDQDERSKPLLHLMELLRTVQRPPRFLFVENVPNFETSRCRELLVDCLRSVGGYRIKEYMLSPMAFGIPNDRRRYYLSAVRSMTDEENNEQADGGLITSWEGDSDGGESQKTEMPPLSRYLENLGEDEMKAFLVPSEWILKRDGFRFDVVTPSSRRSATVTKSYGTRMVTRSGSLLRTRCLDEEAEPDYSDTPSLMKYGLRFLTPTEVARLQCFPVDEGLFRFPESLTLKQRWGLLGNSLNCRVVAEIMKRDFFALL